MKFAPAIPNRAPSIAKALLGITVAAGAIFGVVWINQPHINPEYFPQMATSALVGFDSRDIFVQSHEVTINEWNRCNAAGKCALRLRLPVGHSDGDYPATGLSSVDANEYIAWLNAKSGHQFRLPTSAEWTAMAATVMPATPDPIFTDPALTWASAYLTEGLVSRDLKPSGSFSQTAEGIFDLDGNVWEWTQDCYSGTGGSIRADQASCPAFFVGGEHLAVIPYLVRDPARGGCAVGSPPPHLGMRLVTDQALPVT